ncbi:glycosyltransferase family 2 protein [Anabaenopsis elenkinii]|jgi:glycosyltransferase involved in cell wall biosynthesis|uniref:Glycosyltransferase family 2 protein n=1 Tax=Anabaenopsis elenkinii CCIBt3563 TaxID=2779889 RepID=A0A7S6U5J5_9CYAN|nr:glycosyltransferase family 2 protein [Anabaenopsis elenkinii]QOV22709.1 glycosyltransferase family 2 protein [Anabaenopsis elenkinii CCIBt3563]
MIKLLTIAIPTFNRATLLDKQLAWLHEEIKGCESECEILISDNCSTDHTQDIIKKWQPSFSLTTFKSHRNIENIGLMANVIHCLKSSSTKYVWTISDDDQFANQVLTYLISKLKKYEDLSLLFLNFSGRNKITGEAVHPPTIIGNRWFDIETEDACTNGKAIFEYCFSKSIGAVSLLSATVYRSELAQKSLEFWQDAASNWLSLAYIAGFCAANGSVIVTKDIYLECTVGVSYWQKDPTSALLSQFKHIPEMILKLEESGYSKEFCRSMILHKAREVNLKVLLGALRRWPVLTSGILIYFFNLITLSTFYLITSEIKRWEIQFKHNY